MDLDDMLEPRTTVRSSAWCRFLVFASFLLIALGSGVVLSCANAGNPETLAKKIQTMASEHLACDDSFQCKSLAFGHRPCGGADAYLPYSTKAESSKTLEALAEKYFKLTAEEQQRNGIGSICEMKEPKPVKCIQHRCQEQ